MNVAALVAVAAATVNVVTALLAAFNVDKNKQPWSPEHWKFFLRDLRDNVLKENGEPPKEGKWADIAVLEPVREYKARHASTMLTFDAVVDAIGQIENKRRAAASK